MDMGQDRDKIVPFAGARKDMRFPAMSEVRAYWEALRNGRTVPLRADIDPRGIERALEYAFILEKAAPQVARFRLSGMHLTDLMGMEVRGMPLSGLFTPAARAEIGTVTEKLFAGPQIAELSLAAETGFGRPPMEARLLMLPLRSDLGDISRALGCLIAEGHIGRAPRRFDVTHTRMTPIAAGQAPRRAGQTAPQGFSETQKGFDGLTVERGHLRLVKSDL
ncbi:MAG: PAS domain-containing protein [Rhodobacteraceae bacterium]|nr:PAS domain-containing protein [Paracoccaceae bacterium]